MFNQTKLPLEFSFLQALKVFLIRLAYFALIATINLLLLDYVLPISKNPIFSLVIYISFLFGSTATIILNIKSSKNFEVDTSRDLTDKRNIIEGTDKGVETLTFVKTMTSALVAESLSSLDTLLSGFAERISNHFGYYYVGVFVGEKDELRLVAVNKSNTELRKRLIDNRFAIRESTGIWGKVFDNPTTKVVNDVNKDPTFLPNPFFPRTKSEAVVPIKLRGQLIGALEIKSELIDTFNQEDVIMLEGLVEQLAVAMENNRLFREAVSRAERERMISDVSSKIGEATSMRNVLQTAVEELEKALGQAVEINLERHVYLDADTRSTSRKEENQTKKISEDERDKNKP